MAEELDLAAREAQRGDVQLQQLAVQLDPVAEHDMRPAAEKGERKLSDPLMGIPLVIRQIKHLANWRNSFRFQWKSCKAI